VVPLALFDGKTCKPMQIGEFSCDAGLGHWSMVVENNGRSQILWIESSADPMSKDTCRVSEQPPWMQYKQVLCMVALILP
jgi:hypothetical protein